MLDKQHTTIMPPPHSFEANRSLNGDFCRVCGLPPANRLHCYDGKSRAWVDGQ